MSSAKPCPSAVRGALDHRRRRAIVVASVAGVILGFVVGVEAQPEESAGSGGLFIAVDGTAARSVRDPGRGSLRERFVRVDLDQLENARVDAEREADRSVLRLNLFDDLRFSAVVERTLPTSGGYALSGRLVGVEGAVSLVVNDGVVAGSVYAPDGTYEIRPLGDDLHAIKHVDPASRRPSGNDWLRPLAPRTAPDRVTPIRPRDAPARPSAAPGGREDGSRIDVLVAFTRTAKARYGGARGIAVLIDHYVTQTNQAFADSGVMNRLHLVGTVEVTYTATDGGTDLDRLAEPADGHMDRIHQLRDRYAADLVTLVVGPNEYDVCGIAYVIWASREAPWGFNVVWDACGALTFAHEVGHNMGLSHDRYEVRSCSWCDPSQKHDLRDIEPFPYSVGYVNQRAFRADAPTSSRWVTIMAYDTQCADWGAERGEDFDFQCGGAPRFSNPRRTWNGDPTGVPGGARSSSVTGPADAARSLNNTRKTIANFRRAPCLRDGAGIRLQASSGQYVVAIGNGGGDVLANRSQAGAWGRFTVVDANGGCVDPGDVVSLRTSDGFYLRARQGGGSTLDATAPRATPWAQFVAGRHRGSGPIRGGDSVTLRARSGHYVWAERGGGAAVRADRDKPGAWGRFKVTHLR